MVVLDQFLGELETSLPTICRDSDLIKNLPDMFRNPCHLTRLRARNQTPPAFYIHPHYFYLKHDVLEWLRTKYQNHEIERENICSPE